MGRLSKILNIRNRISILFAKGIFNNLEYSQSIHQFEYFRIGVSIFSLISFFFFLIDYDILLAPGGVVNWEISNANVFWFEPHLAKIALLCNLPEEFIFFLFLASYLFTLLCLFLGIYTRINSFFAFLLFMILSYQIEPYLYGVELYQSVFLLFLFIFPSGYSKSIFRKVLSEQTSEIQKIGMRGLQFYLCITYFSAGIGKYNMQSWFNGEFLFLSISDPNYQLLHFPDYLPSIIYKILGITVVTVELGYAFFILVPIIRSLLLFCIIIMHLFIGLFMGLIPFASLLIFANIVCWYPIVLEDIKKSNLITQIIRR